MKDTYNSNLLEINPKMELICSRQVDLGEIGLNGFGVDFGFPTTPEDGGAFDQAFDQAFDSERISKLQ